MWQIPIGTAQLDLTRFEEWLKSDIIDRKIYDRKILGKVGRSGYNVTCFVEYWENRVNQGWWKDKVKASNSPEIALFLHSYTDIWKSYLLKDF